MSEKIPTRAQSVADTIDASFTAPYPGDAFLIGSFDGTEPLESIRPFTAFTDWRMLEPAFMDEHSSALSFFSEGGLRFYLPAFLIADVRGDLQTAFPLFHLVHGFREQAVEFTDSEGRRQVYRSGGDVLLNPLRYGAMTWNEAVRHRLSAFCREEVLAIIEYLELQQENSALKHLKEDITYALDQYWFRRGERAPSAAVLRQGTNY